MLSSLTMYRGGFKDPAFTNLEEWWGSNTSAYYAAFDCLGREFDARTDVTAFVVRAHPRAAVAGRRLAVRQRAEGLLWTALENLLEDHGLPPRLANALYDSFFAAQRDHRLLPRSHRREPATARNDLQAAAAAGARDCGREDAQPPLRARQPA